MAFAVTLASLLLSLHLSSPRATDLTALGQGDNAAAPFFPFRKRFEPGALLCSNGSSQTPAPCTRTEEPFGATQ